MTEANFIQLSLALKLREWLIKHSEIKKNWTAQTKTTTSVSFHFVMS